jgi:hypothetical protein
MLPPSRTEHSAGRPRDDRSGTQMVGVHVPSEVRSALRMLAAQNNTFMREEVLRGLHLLFQAEGKTVPALDAMLEEYHRRRGSAGY